MSRFLPLSAATAALLAATATGWSEDAPAAASPRETQPGVFDLATAWASQVCPQAKLLSAVRDERAAAADGPIAMRVRVELLQPGTYRAWAARRHPKGNVERTATMIQAAPKGDAAARTLTVGPGDRPAAKPRPAAVGDVLVLAWEEPDGRPVPFGDPSFWAFEQVEFAPPVLWGVSALALVDAKTIRVTHAVTGDGCGLSMSKGDALGLPEAAVAVGESFMLADGHHVFDTYTLEAIEGGRATVRHESVSRWHGTETKSAERLEVAPYDRTAPAPQGVTASPMDHAKAVQARHEAEIMATAGVVGVGIGGSEEKPELHIYVKDEPAAQGVRHKFKRVIEGVPVKVEVSGVIQAR